MNKSFDNKKIVILITIMMMMIIIIRIIRIMLMNIGSDFAKPLIFSKT